MVVVARAAASMVGAAASKPAAVPARPDPIMEVGTCAAEPGIPAGEAHVPIANAGRSASEATAKAPLPYRLRTEHRAHPLGIEAMQPRLSWQVGALSDQRGIVQVAYQIQVAGSLADLSRGQHLIWDTGRVDSDRSIHVAYGGSALEARRRYHWRVRIWTIDGERGYVDGEGAEREGTRSEEAAASSPPDVSPWSEPAWWEMGLMDPSRWEASWIQAPWKEDLSTSQPSPMLRTEFDLEGDVATARLYATARGVYALHLNGKRVGDAVLTPGWTSYETRLQYQTYDVTGMLRQGRNALGGLLGDGWYRGYIGFQGNRNEYGETLALLAQLEVTYGDGRSEVVAMTDDGWKASTGATQLSDIYHGEIYDARLEQEGWARIGFDDAEWEAVRVEEYDKALLTASEAPDVRRIQTLEPVEIFTTPGGDLVADMGQNMVGWVRIRARGPAGTEIRLRHAEVLDRDGNFYTENLRAARQEVVFILKGDGEEVYEPHFTFQGFRYVAVEGYPGELTTKDLMGIVVHSDMPPSGHFETSHRLINRLQHNIVWGQKGNFVDVPTDCPQRDERLGWTGDAQVFAPTAAYNMDVAGFFVKWLQDVAADQEEDGRIPHVVPDVLDAGGATGWADAGVVIPWVMYQHYGDLQFLERQYPSMVAWVEYVRGRAAMDGTPYVWEEGSHFGDWLAYSTNSPAYPGASTNTDLIATAYFAYSAGLVSEAARLLGSDEDAREYGLLHDAVRGAFLDEFVTSRGRMSSDTQTAYVLALAFDLLPDHLVEEAARRLAKEIRERGHLTTGFLGTPHLTHVLSEHGYPDEAYALLLRTKYPSWLYPVTMDATTIWERWDGIKPDGTFQDKGMNSFNHYAYGAVGHWLYGVVAGIGAAAPGYKRIEIAPRPGGGLTYARARLESVHGLIESSWEWDGASFALRMTIPANTHAIARLPHARLEDVTEGGMPLGDAPGVRVVGQEGEDVVVVTGSGQYLFEYVGGLSEGAREEAAAALSTGGSGAPFDVDARLADLIAHGEARAVLVEHLPDLMDSLWLSQAMGVSLRRVGLIVPVDLSEARLRRVGRLLERIER